MHHSSLQAIARLLVPAILLALPLTAAAGRDDHEWQLYGMAHVGIGAGGMDGTDGKFSWEYSDGRLTPEQASAKPYGLEEYAGRGGGTTSLQPGFTIGMRVDRMIRFEVGFGLDHLAESHFGPRFELMLGADGHESWPIRYDSEWVDIVPTLLVGIGYGGTGAWVSPDEEGWIIRKGLFLATGLRYELRLWRFVIQLQATYRALFTGHQTFTDYEPSFYNQSRRYFYEEAVFSHDFTGRLSFGFVL